MKGLIVALLISARFFLIWYHHQWNKHGFYLLLAYFWHVMIEIEWLLDLVQYYVIVIWRKIKESRPWLAGLWQVHRKVEPQKIHIPTAIFYHDQKYVCMCLTVIMYMVSETKSLRCYRRESLNQNCFIGIIVQVLMTVNRFKLFRPVFEYLRSSLLGFLTCNSRFIDSMWERNVKPFRIIGHMSTFKNKRCIIANVLLWFSTCHLMQHQVF